MLKAGAKYSYYGYDGENIQNIFRARRGKLSISNTFSYIRAYSKGDSETIQEYSESQTAINSYLEFRNRHTTINERLNINYDIANNHSLMLTGVYLRKSGNPITSELISYDDITEETTINEDYTKSKMQVAGNYKWTLNSKGAELNLSADYLSNNDEIEQDYMQADKVNGSTNQKTDLSLVKLDFKHNLWKGLMTFGLDMKYTKTTDNSVSSYYTNGLETSLKGYSPAIYASYKGSVKRLNYDAGVRVQNDRMDIEVADNENNYDNTGIAPMLSLMYMIKPEKGRIVNIQYKRNFGELPYSAISSYKEYTSDNTYTIGNPDLTPSISDEITGVFMYSNKLMIMAMYSRENNQIYYSSGIDEENQVYIKPMNGSWQSLGVLSIELRLKPTSW